MAISHLLPLRTGHFPLGKVGSAKGGTPIAEEFGFDKAADLIDSVDVEPVSDELYARGIMDPSSIEDACEAVADHVLKKVSAANANAELLSDTHDLDTGTAKQ